jgi:hypothetical protein
MPYVTLIIRTVILISSLFWGISLQAQNKSDWYNTKTKTYQDLPTADIRASDNKFTLRISFTNYIIEVSSRSDNEFQGRLVVLTSSYQEGDYNGRFSQKYFTSHAITSDTGRMIFNHFTQAGMAEIPTDKDIPGWRYGTDGITYTIETVTNGDYSRKTYWTPSVFKTIEEAVTVDRFFSSIESLLRLKTKWDAFLSGLPRGKTYQYGSMMLVTLNEAPEKQVKRIVLTYQESDEPPVSGGRPEYKMIFNGYKSQLGSVIYSVGKNQIPFKDTLLLSPSFAKTVTEWARDKERFSLDDLGLKNEQVGDTLTAKRYGLVLPTPTNLIVDIDSLSICRAYSIKQIVSTGGDHISVSILYGDHEDKIEFDNDNLLSKFDLKGYIICYVIFSEILPEAFPAYKFFSEETLVNLVNQYQKIIECEGYYYQEYVSKHPELNTRDRRMMKGWDFKKYLRETKRLP